MDHNIVLTLIHANQVVQLPNNQVTTVITAIAQVIKNVFQVSVPIIPVSLHVMPLKCMEATAMVVIAQMVQNANLGYVTVIISVLHIVMLLYLGVNTQMDVNALLMVNVCQEIATCRHVNHHVMPSSHCMDSLTIASVQITLNANQENVLELCVNQIAMMAQTLLIAMVVHAQ